MKETKAEANYRDRPNKGDKCAECRHFLAPHACEKVKGSISSNGWCSWFNSFKKAAKK